LTALPLKTDWLAALHARASQAPLQPRVPLLAGGIVIGSVLSELVDEIGTLPSWDIDSLLLKQEFSSELAWNLQGELTASLASIARALHEADIGHVRHHWRDEQLAVLDDQGQHLGSVERGAVRPLGIATRAVHLVGQTADGRVWVQQRALDKSNDPGQWDTLMGGMVSAQDSLEAALARETWEEAGLVLGDLQAVTHGGCVRIQRPTAGVGDGGDDAGIGYMVEAIDWFQCRVPDGMVPVNQDGEVAQFKLLSIDELAASLQRDEFTLEAAQVLVAAFGTRTNTCFMP
jgi:8-oxo-dGTP pyrophosphatase MutT (NUDIX family)